MIVYVNCSLYSVECVVYVMTVIIIVLVWYYYIFMNNCEYNKSAKINL